MAYNKSEIKIGDLLYYRSSIGNYRKFYVVVNRLGGVYVLENVETKTRLLLPETVIRKRTTTPTEMEILLYGPTKI